MKKLLTFALALFLLTACKKEQENTTNSKEVSAKDPNEVSLVQESRKLKSDLGDILTVTYFAKGDNIAVKLEQEGKLSLRKKLTPKANLFSQMKK